MTYKEFDYELWILGEGSERAVLEQYIVESGLCDSVRLLGFQENPYKFMKNADLFVCSSISEGFSTVATEAVILGLLILTTDCSGMKELLGDSYYGRIVSNDEKGLHEGLKVMLSDKELFVHYARMDQLGEERFLIKDIIKKIEEAFDS